jgi:hypothetical protein
MVFEVNFEEVVIKTPLSAFLVDRAPTKFSISGQ